MGEVYAAVTDEILVNMARHFKYMTEGNAPSGAWEYQTIKLVEGSLDGTTRIEVTAASGATSTYRLNFRLEKSNKSLCLHSCIDDSHYHGFDR